MRNFLAALGGALLGAAVVVAVAVAVPSPASHATGATVMPMGASMASMNEAGPAAVTRRLTIVHVQRGCHLWSNGKTTAATMRLHLMRGDHLSIMDMDVDAHQLMQSSGPARMSMGGPMTMNHGRTLTFQKTGVYRFVTKTVEMPGAMEVETIGPDNTLRLVVTVA